MELPNSRDENLDANLSRQQVDVGLVAELMAGSI